MKVDGFEKDYIMIRYAGTDTLYVPATALDMVTKYLGAAEDQHVKLSKWAARSGQGHAPAPRPRRKS